MSQSDHAHRAGESTPAHGASDRDHEHGQGVELAYARALGSYRRSRDAAFAEEAGSPLLPKDRAQFHGLRYFPPDLRYRLEGLAAEPYAGQESPAFVMQTSDRQPRPARRVATLRFELDGRPLALHAYAFADSEPGSLFVPFTDGTSGHETYAAGRYLDLEPEDDGSYTLDFNLAYHPLCVYSPFFSCPIPPPENRLPVRIEAGEMLPLGIGGH
jgi:uncharacterized protein (DUF1684 family)